MVLFDMKELVIKAEKHSSKTADFTDVKDALEEASKDRLNRCLKAFTDTETALLKAASELCTSQAGELFVCVS